MPSRSKHFWAETPVSRASLLVNTAITSTGMPLSPALSMARRSSTCCFSLVVTGFGMRLSVWLMC